MKTLITDITNRKDFLNGKWALEIGYPWLSFGAIIALEGIVNKRLRVLELGSGGTTVFFAKNCKNVKSYETNADWYKKVMQKVRKYRNVEIGLGNHTDILRSVTKEPDRHYDIVLIDSDPRATDRFSLANAVISKVKIGGWLIVDNYWNFGMDKFNYPKSDILTFDDIVYSGRGTRLCRLLA